MCGGMAFLSIVFWGLVWSDGMHSAGFWRLVNWFDIFAGMFVDSLHLLLSIEYTAAHNK